MPVPSPTPVPVPGHKIDPPPGDPTLDSQSLPVSLGCTEQCHCPSVTNDEQSTNQILVLDSALVPAPEHAPDLHSRDPYPGLLSSPGMAPLPMPVRETDPSDHSGSSPKGGVSQPVPEVVTLTCKPLTPPTTASALSQSATDATCHILVAEPLPSLIPVPDTALVPVPEHTQYLPPGEPNFDSNSLPVPLKHPEQCLAPSILNFEPISSVCPETGPAMLTVPEQSPVLIPMPGAALVPEPEQQIDFPSEDSSLVLLSSPSLALLPVLEREPTLNVLGSLPDSLDLSRSSLPDVASQPVSELVIITCEPFTSMKTSFSCS
ncbi:platelet glycoprotein Ib alpha chain-like [Macrobrachium rosenbergii]|uniref:platelet glycoprotein Ib alpha chain-like n=1 Tax=Macrobrachium rosenbergii TaxID=79674 RepID=UPI0034D43BF7